MAQTNRPYSKSIAEQLIKRLDNNPEIVLNPSTKLSPPCRNNTFDIIEDSMGVHFDEEIKSFYSATNGLIIVWGYSDTTTGEVHIVPIMDTMLEEYDDFWKSEMKKSKSLGDPKFQAFIQNLYSLDIYETTTQGTLRVVMEIDKNTEKAPKLWLWHLAGERFPLSLSFKEYIQKLIETRGYFGWQYFFIDLKSCDFKDSYFTKFFAESCADALPKMKDFMEIMPRLFPEDDFSEFEKLQQKLIENYQSG